MLETYQLYCEIHACNSFYTNPSTRASNVPCNVVNEHIANLVLPCLNAVFNTSHQDVSFFARKISN